MWHESGRRARLYAGGERERVSLKDKTRLSSEQLSQLKEESKTTNEQINDMDNSSDNDLLLPLPDPEPIIRGRRFFRETLVQRASAMSNVFGSLSAKSLKSRGSNASNLSNLDMRFENH